jgi:hypothetical protein
MNLTGYTFTLPGATLQVTGENVITGNFAAVFHDASSGIDVPINFLSGRLQHIGPSLDKMVFHGTGTKGPETEQVLFNGDLHEALFPLMFGRLTEVYRFPAGRRTVSRIVEGRGHPPGTHPPLAPNAGTPAGAGLPGGPVSLNPKPLPPGNSLGV